MWCRGNLELKNDAAGITEVGGVAEINRVVEVHALKLGLHQTDGEVLVDVHIQSASRTFMARLIPKGKESQMFGFYAFCGKSSSVFGPIVFGMVSARSGGNQRLAILSVGALFFLGLILLQRVKAPTIPSAE